MKRLHVHVAVDDLDRAVPFYVTLFGAEPSLRHPDYAKWMLDDPRVNFAISQRGRAAGLDHLGIQVEAADELAAVSARLGAAGQAVVEEHQATCCYARSDKAWVTDPAGIAWETFLTHGSATAYGEDHVAEASAGACCGDAACGTAIPATVKGGDASCCARAAV
jgi:catechol 2,3-dioxygenase-like lactoylglutathione lyase family enzyme